MKYFEDITIKNAEEVYGKKMIDEILSMNENVYQVINYLESYEIDFYDEIFERYPYLFTLSIDEWQKIMREVIGRYEVEYKDKLEEDLSVLEEIYDRRE